jgi:hypothetical protein
MVKNWADCASDKPEFSVSDCGIPQSTSAHLDSMTMFWYICLKNGRQLTGCVLAMSGPESRVWENQLLVAGNWKDSYVFSQAATELNIIDEVDKSLFLGIIIDSMEPIL